MTVWPEAQWAKVSDDELSTCGPFAEAMSWLRQEGAAYECWRVQWGSTDPILILFVPSLRSAGVVWGASQVEWAAECAGAPDALTRYLAGKTIR